MKSYKMGLSTASYDDYVKSVAAGEPDTLKRGTYSVGPNHMMKDYLFNTVLEEHLKALYKTPATGVEKTVRLSEGRAFLTLSRIPAKQVGPRGL